MGMRQLCAAKGEDDGPMLASSAGLIRPIPAPHSARTKWLAALRARTAAVASVPACARTRTAVPAAGPARKAERAVIRPEPGVTKGDEGVASTASTDPMAAAVGPPASPAGREAVL